MDVGEKIELLNQFKEYLRHWEQNHDDKSRSEINQRLTWVRREVIEAGCFKTLNIGPPPAVGGLIMRNVDPFNLIFNPPYLTSMVPTVIDMIDQTIGVMDAEPDESSSAAPRIAVDASVQRGYVFIAMPISPGDAQTEDVLDAIKEVAQRCGLHAERVDERQSNDQITDRILESIRKAQYVIADLSGARPNVFYEAGYAQGLGKTPIYIACRDTNLEFDLKDYPVIFFQGMRQLKDSLEKRLRGLGNNGKV